MLDVVYDMETSDPDDFLTLILLLGHPAVNLKAVTVTPGTPDQIGLIRQALLWFKKDIAVGAYNLAHPKSCVSPWHYSAFGNVSLSKDAKPGGEALVQNCDEKTTLITGAPLKNLGAAIDLHEQGYVKFCVGRWVAQGGFAGEGVIPAEKQLDKFKGLLTCPTYNLNGDIKSALRALQFKGIGVKRFVSKNICHRVYYDMQMHECFTQLKEKSLSLQLIWQGMDSYLKKHPEGKKFHDPLAACCAIDESIGTWAEVELFREGGEWGSKLSPGSGTWIITDYDHDKFLRTLTAYKDVSN